MRHAARRGRVRTGLAVALTGLLLASACKSSGNDEPEPSANGSGTAAATEDPRAPGVTDDSIKVGITYVDLSRIGDAVGVDHGDYEAAYQAVVDDINAGGGIHGRTIEPIFAPIDPTAPNAAAAACTRLTEDEEVFVVVGFFLGDEALCYLETNPTPVVGGDMNDERLGRAEVAWYTVGTSSDLESDVVRAMAEGGELDGTVAVVGMAADQQILEEDIEPLLDDLGVDVVDTALIDAPPEDAEANYAQSQTFAERFDADGADQVLVIGGTAAVGFLTGLGRTGYRPELRFTVRNTADAYVLSPGNDLAPFEGAVTGGLYDGVNEFEGVGGPTEECVALQEAAGLTVEPARDIPPGEPAQVTASLAACTQMYLLEAILDAAGEDLSFGSFKTAGDTLGEVTLPFFPDPLDFGAPPQADGDPVAELYAWDPEIGQFELSE